MNPDRPQTIRESARTAFRNISDPALRSRLLERFADLDSGVATPEPSPEDYRIRAVYAIRFDAVMRRLEGHPDSAILAEWSTRLGGPSCGLTPSAVDGAVEFVRGMLAELPQDSASLLSLLREMPTWAIDGLWLDSRPTPTALTTWCDDWQMPDWAAAQTIIVNPG